MPVNEKDTKYARWLNGNLSPEELEALQSSGEQEDLEKIIRIVDDIDLPEYDVESAYSQFKSNRPQKKSKVRVLNTRWVMGIAASVLLIIAAIFLLRNQPKLLEAANQTNQTFAFSDGSDVILNDGSNIQFDEKKWAENRVVELTGEAFFSVESGGSFLVKTKNGTVEVLGTQFNVRSWGDKLYVECYEGKVRVKDGNESSELTRNQSVSIVDGQMTESEIIHQKPLWSTGASRFYNESLNEVFAELERQFDIKVNGQNINRTFEGVFTHSDLETALREICQPLGLKFTILEDRKSVSISE